MKRNLLTLLVGIFTLSLQVGVFSQSISLCDNNSMNATPFCTDLNPYGITYNAGTSGYASELYYLNTTGCLDANTGGVNPAWYKMKISNPGTLNIYMAHSAGCDIDYACWGPFSDQEMSDMCSGFPATLGNYLYDNLPYSSYYYYYYQYGEQYFSHHPTYVDNNYSSLTYGMSWTTDWYTVPSGKLVDCSATPSATEWVHIKNAQPGEWYILLISNWEGCNGVINFMSNAATSTANTDCSITSLVSGDEVCEGDTAILVAEPNQNAVNYTWSGPNGFSQTTVSNKLIISNVTLAQAGQYSVKVYNGASFGDETSCDLIVHPIPKMTISNITICRNDTAMLSVTGAASYLWDSGSTDSSYSVAPSETTVYTVTGTIAGMCTATATVTVSVLDSLIITVMPDSVCVGEHVTVSGHNGLTYLWSDGSTSPHFTPTSADISSYTVVASTVQGCTGTATVYVLPSPVAEFTVDSWTVDWDNATVQFTDLSVDAISWHWTFGGIALSNNTSEEQHPSFTFPYAGFFGVTLDVESENGCKASVSHQIKVAGDEFFLYVPSAFTPNGNTLNDIWKPYGAGVEKYEAYVYDRYGRLMFSTTDIDEGWDGRIKGVLVPVGCYTYRIIVTFVDFSQKIYKGTVTVVN